MKKRLALAFAVLMLLGTVLTGCTGSPAASTAPAASAAASAAATTAAATEAAATTEATAASTGDKILRFGTSSLDGKFNPLLCDGVYDQYVCTMLFDGLIGQNPDGSVNKDGIASDYTISDDKLTYTFTLRDNAKFSNGDPVTAEDVKFTYEVLGDKSYDGPAGYFLNGIVGAEDFKAGKAKEITGIKVIDPTHVSFTVTEPNVVKIYELGIGIISKKAYAYKTWDEFKAKNATPVGCGRFNFASYTTGQSLNVVANPDYFGKKAQIDGVSILMIPDETQVAALKSGQIDLINPSANKDNFDGMNDPSASYVKQFPGNGYNVIGMDQRNPMFSDKRVRQALAYGVNIDQFIQNEWEGFAHHCLTPISTVSWAYPDVSELNKYEYNPEKAKQLLDEAGWKVGADGIREKDGKKLSFTWLAYNDVAWPQHLISLATEQWKAIGVDLKSELVDFNTVSDRVFTKQQYEMFNIGWSLSVDPDPVGMYDKASSVPGGYNAMYFYNKRAEEIFKQGRLEFDQTKRAVLYKEWAKIANEELPYIFCANRDEIWGVSNRVQGFDNMGSFYNWTYCLGDVTIK